VDGHVTVLGGGRNHLEALALGFELSTLRGADLPGCGSGVAVAASEQKQDRGEKAGSGDGSQIQHLNRISRMAGKIVGMCVA
jgi:hypothetical protein